MATYQSKCFVYYGPGNIKTETREITCDPTDIIIRVDVCGRCGTDRRLFDISHPRVKTPTVLGHELVGRIVEVGSKVSTLTQGIGYKDGQTLGQDELCLKIDQRVTVQSRIARHQDGLMLMNDPIQNLSFCIPGAFAQYMKVSEDMIRAGALLPLADSVTDEEGALVEPAACVLESIFATPHPVGVDKEGRHIIRSGIKQGGRTLIIGSGTLALIYAQLAKCEGADEVWFMVRSQAKVDLIKSLIGDWAKFKVVPDYSEMSLPEKLKRETELEKELSDQTNGEFFDDIVLACPSKDAQRFMLKLFNPDGYGVAACFAGLHATCEDALVDNLHYRMSKAIGTSGCSTRTMETIIDWIACGKLSLKGLTCSHHYTLDDDPDDFFQTACDGRKPMLFPWE